MNPVEKIYTAMGHNRNSFAKLMNVTNYAVEKWEKGEMSMATVKALHEYFGVSYEFLFGTDYESGNDTIDRILDKLKEVDDLRRKEGWR